MEKILSAPNKQILGDEEVEESVVLLLRAELDIVSPLQTAAIGLLKQLTVSNSEFLHQFRRT